MAVTQTAVAAAEVEITGLEFTHPGGGHQLLDISLSVHTGELCCLLGPNGAGKTTLLRCLLGLLHPTGGAIRIKGEDITGMSARERARRMAYVPQSTATAFPFTTLDMVVMGRTPHLSFTSTPSPTDRRMALGVLERLGIDHLADRSFSVLSGGERQLALVARALVQEAPVLILDEPTAALDYGNAVRMLRTITTLVAAECTVLMTTHEPNHALSIADRAVLMRGGRIVSHGRPVEVITAQRLSELYEVAVDIIPAFSPSQPDRRVCTPVI